MPSRWVPNGARGSLSALARGLAFYSEPGQAAVCGGSLRFGSRLSRLRVRGEFVLLSARPWQEQGNGEDRSFAQI